MLVTTQNCVEKGPTYVARIQI